MHFSLYLLISEAVMTRACSGGGGGHYPDYYTDTTTTENPVYYGDYSSNETATSSVSSATESTISVLDKNIHGAYGGWEVPPKIADEWKAWLEEFKEKKRLQDLEHKKMHHSSKNGSERGKASGWPSQWRGLGPGEPGFPPQEIPPWGYRNKNTGLPLLCYLAPDIGKCDNTSATSVIRWGYNAYTQECHEFKYSGCRGNLNNFVDRLACEDACIKPPPDGGCDVDTDILATGDFSTDDDPAKIKFRRCGNLPVV